MLKIIFAGTPHIAVPCLQALIDSPHEILAVYTQPDRPAGRGQKIVSSPVKHLALAHQLPVFQPENLSDKEAQQQLQNLNADIMVVIAYGLILPADVLQIFPYGCINIHVSLLPRWRGAAPIHRAIQAGDTETGITIMQMNEGLDTGDILLQKSCAIYPEDTTAELHDRLAALAPEVLLTALAKLEAHELEAYPQDPVLTTYAAKVTKQEGKLDWKKSAEELARKVKAFNPWPIAFTSWQGQPLRIWQAEAIDEKIPFNPGVIVKMDKQGIDVATAKGSLRILRLQSPGGKPMSVAEFLNAHQQEMQVGMPFGG